MKIHVKTILGTLAIVFIFFTIYQYMNKNNEVSLASNNTVMTTDTPTKNQETGKPIIYKMGETIKLDKFSVTVNSIKTFDETSRAMAAKKGNIYFIVNCTLLNITDTEQESSWNEMYKVINKDGLEYNSTFTSQASAKGRLNSTVLSGMKLTGEYVVEIRKDEINTQLYFMFKDDPINGKQAIINLNTN